MILICVAGKSKCQLKGALRGQGGGGGGGGYVGTGSEGEGFMPPSLAIEFIIILTCMACVDGHCVVASCH